MVSIENKNGFRIAIDDVCWFSTKKPRNNPRLCRFVVLHAVIVSALRQLSTYRGSSGLINREYHYCKYTKLQETSLKVLVYNKKLRRRPEPLGEFIIPYAGSPAVSSVRPLTRFHSWALTPAGKLLIANIRNFGIRSPTRYWCTINKASE